MSQDTGSTIEQAQRIAETEILERRAQLGLGLARYIAWGASIVVLVTAAVGLWTEYGQLFGLTVTAFLVAMAMGFYPVFYRQGRTVVGMGGAISSLLIACTVTLILIPEFSMAVAVAFVLVIALGTMLLGPQSGSWLIIASALLMMVAIIIPSFVPLGWITPLDEGLALGVGLFVLLMAFLVAAIVIRQNIVDQEAYFRQSKEANWEIEARIAAEQSQRQRLQRAVEMYVEYMADVGQGHLAARLKLDEDGQGADDPLIVLGEQLNDTTARLQSMIQRIRGAAKDLNTGAAEILAATTQQMSGASEQSAAISQTTTTVDEVKVIADQSVARAQEVADMALRTVEVSRAGSQAVEDTIVSMGEIKNQVESIAENILTLSQHTQQIRDIISTVNDLASQSNMLALNAAVEAARAGEHGKGFAVVAQEVRSLAEQSRQATGQVRTILEDIQQATNTTVMATEEGTKKVDSGVQLAAQSGEAIRQLAGVIDESSQAAMQMVAGGRQQASGIEQIALAMQNINQATTQSLSSTRQAEQAARDLNDLARSLTETVEQYQL